MKEHLIVACRVRPLLQSDEATNLTPTVASAAHGTARRVPTMHHPQHQQSPAAASPSAQHHGGVQPHGNTHNTGAPTIITSCITSRAAPHSLSCPSRREKNSHPGNAKATSVPDERSKVLATSTGESHVALVAKAQQQAREGSCSPYLPTPANAFSPAVARPSPTPALRTSTPAGRGMSKSSAHSDPQAGSRGASTFTRSSSVAAGRRSQSSAAGRREGGGARLPPPPLTAFGSTAFAASQVTPGAFPSAAGAGGDQQRPQDCLTVAGTRRFFFDAVFDDQVHANAVGGASPQGDGCADPGAMGPLPTEAAIFNVLVAPLVDDVLGLNSHAPCAGAAGSDAALAPTNATFMVYGQTGSGKTHTLRGVVPQVVRRVLQQRPESTRVAVSMIEVYGDEIRDLLVGASSQPAAFYAPNAEAENINAQPPGPSGGGSSGIIALYDAGDGNGPCVVGANVVSFDSERDAMVLFERAYAARATAATGMNAQSSRSHAIYSILSTTADGRRSKLHLVDLAGSERQKKTHNTGQRMKESVGINGELLALGNVIRAVAAGQAHVPYRGCKLTRLLQDALGGNSRTVFLACVSPLAASKDETLRTLEYSAKAKLIVNEPVAVAAVPPPPRPISSQPTVSAGGGEMGTNACPVGARGGASVSEPRADGAGSNGTVTGVQTKQSVNQAASPTVAATQGAARCNECARLDAALTRSEGYCLALETRLCDLQDEAARAAAAATSEREHLLGELTAAREQMEDHTARMQRLEAWMVAAGVPVPREFLRTSSRLSPGDTGSRIMPRLVGAAAHGSCGQRTWGHSTTGISAGGRRTVTFLKSRESLTENTAPVGGSDLPSIIDEGSATRPDATLLATGTSGTCRLTDDSAIASGSAVAETSENFSALCNSFDKALFATLAITDVTASCGAIDQNASSRPDCVGMTQHARAIASGGVEPSIVPPASSESAGAVGPPPSASVRVAALPRHAAADRDPRPSCRSRSLDVRRERFRAEKEAAAAATALGNGSSRSLADAAGGRCNDGQPSRLSPALASRIAAARAATSTNAGQHSAPFAVDLARIAAAADALEYDLRAVQRQSQEADAVSAQAGVGDVVLLPAIDTSTSAVSNVALDCSTAFVPAVYNSLSPGSPTLIDAQGQVLNSSALRRLDRVLAGLDENSMCERAPSHSMAFSTQCPQHRPAAGRVGDALGRSRTPLRARSDITGDGARLCETAARRLAFSLDASVVLQPPGDSAKVVEEWP